MKITKVSYQKTYSIGPYLTDRVGFEAEITQNPIPAEGVIEIETEGLVLSRLEKIADDWHKKQHPHLYQESKEPWIPGSEFPEHMKTKITFGPPPTIQTERGDPDDTLSLIQEAPSMEALATFKIIAGADKTLYEAYCKRMKYLSA